MRVNALLPLIFQCRLFADTPYLYCLKSSARPAPWRPHDRSFAPQNEIAEAPPSRRQRVGLIAGRSADHLNVGRSADRRRRVGAPLARTRIGASEG